MIILAGVSNLLFSFFKDAVKLLFLQRENGKTFCNLGPINQIVIKI